MICYKALTSLSFFVGTSLLFSAPESWLVGESQKIGDDPNGEYLGETFGMVSVIILSIIGAS